MARLARVVVPGLPHHITQRGNRRQQTFFRLEDYALYLEVLQGHERTGGPLGDADFLVRLEKNLGRVLRRQKPGRKRNPIRK